MFANIRHQGDPIAEQAEPQRRKGCMYYLFRIILIAVVISVVRPYLSNALCPLKDKEQCPTLRKCERKGQSSPKGCEGIAYRFEHGKGAKKNLKRAWLLYQKACQSMHGAACNQVGILLLRPKRLKLSRKRNLAREITHWFQRACGHQYAKGCNNLGVHHERTGRYQKAAQAYAKACKLEYGRGCRNLALLYTRGKGVGQSPKEALRFTKKACQYQDPGGCRNLGIHYERSYPRRCRKANEAYQKGCRFGDKQLCQYRCKRPKTLSVDALQEKLKAPLTPNALRRMRIKDSLPMINRIRVTLSQRSLWVRGRLSKAEIRQTLQRRNQAFAVCYAVHLLTRAHQRNARVTLRWRIDHQGKTKRTRADSRNRRTASLQKCLKQQLSGIVFPRPRRGQVFARASLTFHGPPQ